MTPLKFIDLFAGLGGFHLALKSMGCECVFASELREDLRKLYVINFPEMKGKTENRSSKLMYLLWLKIKNTTEMTGV